MEPLLCLLDHWEEEPPTGLGYGDCTVDSLARIRAFRFPACLYGVTTSNQCINLGRNRSELRFNSRWYPKSGIVT